MLTIRPPPPVSLCRPLILKIMFSKNTTQNYTTIEYENRNNSDVYRVSESPNHMMLFMKEQCSLMRPVTLCTVQCGAFVLAVCCGVLSC